MLFTHQLNDFLPNLKCKQLCSRFQLGALYPFPTTITLYKHLKTAPMVQWCALKLVIFFEFSLIDDQITAPE